MGDLLDDLIRSGPSVGESTTFVQLCAIDVEDANQNQVSYMESGFIPTSVGTSDFLVLDGL